MFFSKWSIGIYTGADPLHLAPPVGLKNPVLTAEDITDISARSVADPFMICENKLWYMFFEALNTARDCGEIALATSEDGLQWKYKRVVLSEPFHLSYPYVFKWQQSYYMLPETRQAQSVRLYKATRFPTEWVHVGTLLHGDYADPSILRYQKRWWLFVLRGIKQLCLYYADRLIGPWTEHPQSPLISSDKTRTRPGGRMLIYNHQIIRMAQNGYPSYGFQLRVFHVDTLTVTAYHESEFQASPLLQASGNGWNSTAMHHSDPHQIGRKKWIACVDGAKLAIDPLALPVGMRGKNAS